MLLEKELAPLINKIVTEIAKILSWRLLCRRDSVHVCMYVCLITTKAKTFWIFSSPVHLPDLVWAPFSFSQA